MIKIVEKKCSVQEIFKYFCENSGIFIPPHADRIDLIEYTNKIHQHARQTWAIDNINNAIAGFMACYFNNMRCLSGCRTRWPVLFGGL